MKSVKHLSLVLSQRFLHITLVNQVEVAFELGHVDYVLRWL